MRCPFAVRRHLEKAHGKVFEPPKRRKPPPPSQLPSLPGTGTPSLPGTGTPALPGTGEREKVPTSSAPPPQPSLPSPYSQHQAQQAMQQQQQQQSDCQQQQQQQQQPQHSSSSSSNHSHSSHRQHHSSHSSSSHNHSKMQSDCSKQSSSSSGGGGGGGSGSVTPGANDYKHSPQSHHSARGSHQDLGPSPAGSTASLGGHVPPPLIAVGPPPPAHDPPPAHSAHTQNLHKHYHDPNLYVPSTSHAAAQLAPHHLTGIPQFHNAPPPPTDRPVFPDRSHMDRPMFPPPSHNDRDPGSRSGYPSTPHTPHGHDRDTPGRPVFPSDQLMERAMRGDGQFFYPLNLMQQAAAASTMHFNMDQFLQLASQTEGSHGNHMSMSHPPNSISQ